MAVGVIDVGSNSVRLLVATLQQRELIRLREERERIGLGDDVERFGAISPEKLARTTAAAKKYASIARQLGVERLEVLVTAPGRQSANANELVRELAGAAGVSVRVLSAEEEGRLAYEGAADAIGQLPETLAVCDVGGGSTEAVVGVRDRGPVWLRSFDIGAVRLTRRCFDTDPPTRVTLAEARDVVAAALTGAVPPLCERSLATGGTPRALRRIAGEMLGTDELEAVLQIVTAAPARAVAERFGIDRRRARLLPAGVLILAAVQRRLVVPIEVSAAGLREGAVLGLLSEAAAA